MIVARVLVAGIILSGGPYLRKVLPEGVSLSDFVQFKQGKIMRYWVSIVLLITMFNGMCGEITSIGYVVNVISPGIPASVPIIVLTTTSFFFVTLGGMPVLMKTDLIQGIFATTLVIFCSIALLATNNTTSEAFNNVTSSLPVSQGMEWFTTLTLGTLTIGI